MVDYFYFPGQSGVSNRGALRHMQEPDDQKCRNSNRDRFLHSCSSKI